MVLNWPEIETQTFDFATFSRRKKPYSEAKQEIRQTSEPKIPTGWSAPGTMPGNGKGSAAKYDRDLKPGSARAGRSRELPCWSLPIARARFAM